MVIWFLYFQYSQMHYVYGILLLILVFGLPELPNAVSVLIPWHVIHVKVPARIVSIEESPLYGSDYEPSTAPTGYLTTYHYSFIGTGRRVYVGETREIGKKQYAAGGIVTVRYLPYFPYISRIEGVEVSFNGHEFFFGLALPFLAVIILVSVYLIQRGMLRFYRLGRITTARFIEKTPIAQKQREPGDPKTLLLYRFIAADQREYSAQTEGRKSKQYGDEALVAYLPKRPSENMLIPKKWEISPLALDEKGELRPLAGRWLFVVLLPTLYLSVLVFAFCSIYWVTVICPPFMLFLWFSLHRIEYAAKQ